MKGPLRRIHYDVRRIWHCPECHRTVKTAGTVVFKRCNCKPEGVWMQILPRPERKFEIHDTYTLEEAESDELEASEEVVVEETLESSETKTEDQQPNPPQHDATKESTNEISSDAPQKESSQDKDNSDRGFDSGIFED